MGSSAKKRKEKKKDFQKPKLKVGKTKAKASNFTDTSFRAKSIVLTQQSLSASAPTITAQCAHHIGLLNHKSDSQRRESLAYLTSAIVSNPAGTPLPQPASVILPAVQRLILDGSNAVRQQLLKLLQSLPETDVAGHADQLLLHTRAGMTHLSVDIRNYALDVLDWLLSVAGDEVVSCAGGWVKMLKCFLGLLNWQTAVSGKWSTTKSIGKAGGDAKLQAKQINALASFVKAGIVPSQVGAPIYTGSNIFPLCQTQHHMLPQYSNAYAYLNLFGTIRDEESEMYEDREDRQRVFHEKAEGAITEGLQQATRGGGELGRAAAQLRRVIREGMADYQSDSG